MHMPRCIQTSLCVFVECYVCKALLWLVWRLYISIGCEHLQRFPWQRSAFIKAVLNKNHEAHKTSDGCACIYVCVCVWYLCMLLALSAVAFSGMWNTSALIKSKHSGRFDYSLGSQSILSWNWLAKKTLRKPKKTHQFRQQHLHKYQRMNGSPQYDWLQNDSWMNYI